MRAESVTPRLLLLGLVGLPLAACSKPLSTDECERLLDRYVELLVRSDQPDLMAEELVRMKREARSKAASDPAFRSCSREVSRTQYECAMSASDADKLEQCML